MIIDEIGRFIIQHLAVPASANRQYIALLAVLAIHGGWLLKRNEVPLLALVSACLVHGQCSSAVSTGYVMLVVIGSLSIAINKLVLLAEELKLRDCVCSV